MEDGIFFCVLSLLDIERRKEYSPFNEISSTLINSIAKNTIAFFVDAYDKEGYLMWQRE